MASQDRRAWSTPPLRWRGALLGADDEQAQRGMSDEGTHVDPLAPLIDCRQVLGKRLEAPVDALVEGIHRHAFDVLEGPHDDVAMLRAGGGDAEAAVAHDDAGHPVPARRGQVAVPEDLGVVVGVDVDEPGSQYKPSRSITSVPLGRRQPTGSVDAGDAVALDGHVGRPGRAARTVDQRGSPQKKIHHPPVPSWAPKDSKYSLTFASRRRATTPASLDREGGTFLRRRRVRRTIAILHRPSAPRVASVSRGPA